MYRSRLLWFTLGFSLTAASISQFIYKDLWTDRYALKSDMKQKFDSLEARVLNLESLPPENPNSAQVEDLN
ncbi:PREDICTED: uncharacterized protein LOC18612570 isoform X1 [Theobroma cacao]|uniref:Uncharacterized protein LOC18612570 isoform X1 n=1 Tax=Theobroma cacao TaxID=3641 RepID=A0AB32VTN4_THECC|nr:PREDICTED: uncharacterized protein LOC18612570 isoform X1 [Theobroma cacao]